MYCGWTYPEAWCAVPSMRGLHRRSTMKHTLVEIEYHAPAKTIL